MTEPAGPDQAITEYVLGIDAAALALRVRDDLATTTGMVADRLVPAHLPRNHPATVAMLAETMELLAELVGLASATTTEAIARGVAVAATVR